LPRILRPREWKTADSRPIIAIDRSDVRGALLVRVVESGDFDRLSTRADPFHTTILREDAGDVVTFRLERPLRDWGYIVFVTPAEEPDRLLAKSGFMVRDRFGGLTFPLSGPRAHAAFQGAVLPSLPPAAIDVAADGSVPRRLNIVLPTLLKRHFSGGPNTALALGQVLAEHGIPVNFLSTDTGAEEDEAFLVEHLAVLTGIRNPRGAVTFSPANDYSRPATIGHTDIMLGTAWWTVQKFRHCLEALRTPRFVYLIQEYEPALYPHSMQFALAAETYRLDHLPIYNHRFLYDYFSANRIGSRAAAPPARRSPWLRRDAPQAGGDETWFDPVIDPAHFHYDEAAHDGPERKLLFYARPTVAVRNLFELGYAALAKVVGEGSFADSWRLCSMGESVGDVYLPHGKVMEELPWQDFAHYAASMRSCDVLLSLMLSPHPSYPPLEGAASGAIVVTNEFANKTAAAFARISANIIAVPPSIDDVARGLREAIARVEARDRRRAASRLSLPASWSEALAPAAKRIIEFWNRSDAARR